MDVGSLNTQIYSPAPAQAPAPTPAPVSDSRESAEAVAAATTQSAVVADPEKTKTTTAVDAEKIVADKMDDRQVEDMLSRSIKEANKKLAMTSNELQYSYHKRTRSVAIKVINSDTKEVVREIPPIKTLDALAKVWELAGILVDEKK